MPEKHIDRVDTGIVTNKPTTDVLWSTGRNVRFKPGAVYKTPGKKLLATVPGALSIREMFTFKAHDGTFRTIVCCDAKVFSYTNNFTTYTDITPTPAPTGTGAVWQFTLVGGMPVITNGINGLWKWADLTGPLTALNNGPARARALATFGNRLIAGYMQEGAYDIPGRLRWPGIGEPEAWAMDLKGKGGGQDLVDSATGMDAIERIKGFGVSGSRLIVYTERNIWFADPADFPAVFAFKMSELEKGLVASRAKTRAPGLNAFMSIDDFYSVEKGEGFGFNIRNSVFGNLNKTAIDSAFAFYRPLTKEIYFCVPTGSNTAPDTAFVFQRETKAWSICDCNYQCHTFAFDESGYSWETAPFGAWDDTGDSRWDELWKTGILPYEVVGNSQGQILRLDDGDDDNGGPITGYIETGDFIMGSPNLNKTIQQVFPGLKPNNKSTHFMIQVGSRPSLHHDISWSRPVALAVGVKFKADFRVLGKFIRLRFYTDQKDTPWAMDSFTFNYGIAGTR